MISTFVVHTKTVTRWNFCKIIVFQKILSISCIPINHIRITVKRKSAEEVCEKLLDIFCDSGPPHILHSDNGREFSNNLLFTTLATKWPTIKIVPGKPRHPEYQGAVERANRDIKDGLLE